ncbi:unnamed protein product, partial [Prorocentrum cordatum]
GARVGSRLPGASRPGGLRGGAAAGRTLPFLLGLLFFALCIPRSSRMDRTDPARRRELVRRSRRNGRPPAAGAAARSSAMGPLQRVRGPCAADHDMFPHGKRAHRARHRMLRPGVHSFARVLPHVPPRARWRRWGTQRRAGDPTPGALSDGLAERWTCEREGVPTAAR